MQDHIKNFNNEITRIYGEPATGKTTIALMSAVNYCKNKKVVFIDTEKSFNLERFKQLGGNVQELDNVFVIRPVSFSDQLEKIESLNKIKNIGLIVVDSLGMKYRKEVRENYKETNDILHKQMKILNDFSKNIPVILTNQVSFKVESNKNDILGGDKLKNWCKKLIRLEKEPRRFIFEKPESKQFLFNINEKGIQFL